MSNEFGITFETVGDNIRVVASLDKQSLEEFQMDMYEKYGEDFSTALSEQGDKEDIQRANHLLFMSGLVIECNRFLEFHIEYIFDTVLRKLSEGTLSNEIEEYFSEDGQGDSSSGSGPFSGLH